MYCYHFKVPPQISSITSVLLSLIPFLLIIILNSLLYKAVRNKLTLQYSSKHERRDIHVAGILILIVIVFASCHSIKWIINLIELIFILQGTCNKLILTLSLTHHTAGPKPNQTPYHGQEVQILVAISHLAITINSSVNWAIYASKVVRNMKYT